MTTLNLQSRPALRLALQDLPSAEQSHVQISLRVLTSKLKVPVVLADDHADIVLKPSESFADRLSIVSAHGQVDVERPVRLVPLSDALAEIIDGFLAHESGRTASASAPAASAAESVTSTSPASTAPTSPGEDLLSLLLRRDRPGPLQITLASGRQLLIDARYMVAFLPINESGDHALVGLASDPVVNVGTLGDITFKQRTAKGNPVAPIDVEQLCWLMTPEASVSAMLQRWHDNPQSVVRQLTWPNLSAQADGVQWVKVLAQASGGALTLADLKQLAHRCGIDAGRADFGISLLFVFKHLEMTVVPSSASITSIEEAARKRAEVAQQASASRPSILSRFGDRLRKLVG